MESYFDIANCSPKEDAFDWNEFLIGEGHSDEEWKQARLKSDEWVTCACGNQCATIPRILGVPVDATLLNLGIDFNRCIDKRNIKLAKETLFKIEARSSEILAQMELDK